jgi:hypothetical protein
MRTRDSIHRKNSPFYGPERFTYQPESNSYLCPAGQPLNYGGRSDRNRTYTYIGTRKRCGACSQRPQCTSAAFRCLAIHMHEPARQRARELAQTPAFASAQRQRKKVEALFAELKNQIGLRRLRLRRMKFVREQFFLAAAAQNIKRLVRFLSQGPKPIPVETTFRTAPLWGLRTHSRLMHDGDSVRLEDAIARHKGEASEVTQKFLRLTPREQEDVLSFLNSL